MTAASTIDDDGIDASAPAAPIIRAAAGNVNGVNGSNDDGTTAATDDSSFCYIFGFGSIMKTSTHAPWLTTDSKSKSSPETSSYLPGRRAVISRCFGYRRGWNFRSATGFTALGIVREAGYRRQGDNGDVSHNNHNDGGGDSGNATDINGVLFRISSSQLPDFDRREVGYDRVEIPKDRIVLHPSEEKEDECQTRDEALSTSVEETEFEIRPNEKIWVYVPQRSYLKTADVDHPILQSYVDTVLQGCLEWGGEDMCRELVRTTSDWSPYFLNDTPSSRRPWLFRQQYDTIDRILSEFPDTRFRDRRHPEEFASAFLMKLLRGFWSVPRRNPVFTGREKAIEEVHARLTAQKGIGNDIGGDANAVTAKLQIVGMGGVGKSQLVTEYCYRYFPSYYGLVIWLNGQSAESVVAGYKQLMADTTGADVKDKDADEVVSEIKARLFRSKIPWLLVFDNLEDESLIQKVVPNGGPCGHVLVTTRLMTPKRCAGADAAGTATTPVVAPQYDDDATMILGCLDPFESVQLLCRAAGDDNIGTDEDMEAARLLSERLGHLPLALGMAAAYMRQCDVKCNEYLARYVKSESRHRNGDGSLLGLGRDGDSVSSSLSLSLNAIKNENETAWQALRLLAWLGPDMITKKLLRSLLLAKTEQMIIDAQAVASVARAHTNTRIALSVGFPLLLFGSATLFGLQKSRRLHFSIGAISLAATAASLWMFPLSIERQQGSTRAYPPTVSSSRSVSLSGHVFEETDQIWTILKSFSLLVVKEGQGTMHRLLGQALRMKQDEVERRRNIRICLRALLKEWTFKPELVETWPESTKILDHAKAVVRHSADYSDTLSLEAAILSREAGVFSAMALNQFQEAQASLEESLEMLNRVQAGKISIQRARSAALHELGRVLRYQGQFRQSEEALQEALAIRNGLPRSKPGVQNEVAATLYELGVLDIKKHNLDGAAVFLEQALDLRRDLEAMASNEENEAACASTLHQLAAVYVARKPPALDIAESLLNEALSLNMQIGQRAATLKQLARVSIRRGEYAAAEKRLAQALELYQELYGKTTLHINVAAVQFQQGTLAFQRDRLEQAWMHFSECLRARRHVYSYSQGNHLEVSLVLHELGCVAMAQKNFEKAVEMLEAEKDILDRLCETSSQRERLLQVPYIAYSTAFQLGFCGCRSLRLTFHYRTSLLLRPD